MAAEPVCASVFVDARPDRVYEYFTDPEAIVRWIGDYALLEPEPNGRFELDIRGTPVRGGYLELEPPHRLLLSWGYAGSEKLPPAASTVEIHLTADGGGTRVDVVHRDLPDEQTPAHQIGWQHYLARLPLTIATGGAGPDPGMPPAEPRSQP